MATYAIGDIQGCFTTLQQLLQLIGFNPLRDRLWLVGDLINRGPDSLAVLRWARQNAQSLFVVLGNHDLHALIVAEGFVAPHRSDTLQELLAAPDGVALLQWLRSCCLAHGVAEYLMVHAGVLPQWDAARTLELAAEVEAMLHGPNYRDFLAHLYGNHPNRWDDGLRGASRLRVITNALTRLRVCSPGGAMDFRFKGKLPDVPDGLLPWFDVPGRRSACSTLVFGHWSELGLLLRDNLIALDTGCIWGGKLTAVRLEDRRVYQMPRAAADAARRQWTA